MMHLKRNHPLPLYVQLKEALRADIHAQRLQPHQQLPSERELCERFQVSRMTVRQAIVDLTREGLIFSRAGKGTFVSAPKIDQQLKTLTGFSQEMQMRGRQASSRVLEATIQPAGDEIAAALHIDPASQVVLLSRVRLADGTPLAIEIVHLPHAYCPNLLRHNFAVESLYEVLERDYGHRFIRAEQTIEAALAGPREIALLQLVPPAPVLVMRRSTFTDQGVLIEYVHSFSRGDRFKFHVTLSLPSLENQGSRIIAPV
jgi:GntR family transcriptional regulator